MVDLGVITKAGQIVPPKADFDQSLVTVVSIDSGHALGATAVPMGRRPWWPPARQNRLHDTRRAVPGDLALHLHRFRLVERHPIDRFAVVARRGEVAGRRGGGRHADQPVRPRRVDGQLRVATHTTSNAWGNGTWSSRNDNGVYCFDADTMQQVGQITGLAPGEQLYAVRYVGDMPTW